MPRNPSNVYSLPAGSTVTTGDTILASSHNDPLNDIAADLNAARPIVAGGTGADSVAGAQTNLGIAGHFADHDTYRCTVGGTANAVTLTTAYSLTTVPQNTLFYFFPTAANTGDVTFNVDGIGAVTARAKNGSQMPAGYLRVGKLTEAYYNGTQWIVDRETERVDNANGIAYKYANGALRGHIVDFKLTNLSASDTVIASTWTFPVASTVVPYVNVGGQGANGATPGSNQIVPPFKSSVSLTGAFIASRTISGIGVTFSSGDELKCDVQYKARWYQ